MHCQMSPREGDGVSKTVPTRESHIHEILDILKKIMYMQLLINSNRFYKLRNCFYEVQEFDHV